MKPFQDPQRNADNILLLLFALFLLASPLVTWWTDRTSPWYLPYVIWGALIGLAALLQIGRDSGDS